MRVIARIALLVSTVATAALVSGCASTRSEIVLRCPQIQEYTAADQDAAGTELDSIPAPCVLCRMMDDYGELRARCRAMGAK